jgi:polyribonucleotide nucleotidyltransferase
MSPAGGNMKESRIFETVIGGRRVSAELRGYASQTNGHCIVRCGDTVVMVNVTMAKSPRDGVDYFPLGVDFEEKMYAIGKIPGGFRKREGRPSDKAILTSRLIDRPLRPLFPKGMYNDVSLVVTTLSVDPEIPPEVFAMIGSSIALCTSDIPFNGPTGSVVVGFADGRYIINPNSEEREKSKLHLTLSGTADAILMVEAGANEASEEEILGAIMFGHEEIKKIVAWVNEITQEMGKPKAQIKLFVPEESIAQAVREYAQEKIEYIYSTFDRAEREAREDAAEEEIKAHFAEIYPDNEKDVADALYALKKEYVRNRISADGVRPDGRGLKDIREIWCEAGIFPRVHGSGVFTRGQTQAMTLCTLGTLSEVQKLESLDEIEFKRYMHHYNFPPYSTGEAKPLRFTGRREIGHGALAERALEPVLPNEESFPYAIRTVSEIVSSNGSTSQASICGSTLSLMDAGVPIKAPVAGIAMGLIKDASGKVSVLSDIQGLEDFFGDMDFKVAGTAEGITAIQMDIKINGIDRKILETALEQARVGRLYILNIMSKTLAAPRPELSPYAPKITSFTISKDKIKDVIGTGGKVINKIIEQTGVKIDINDDGLVFISSTDLKMIEKAEAIIKSIVIDPVAGDEFEGEVKRILDFGAFVEISPGREGMVHISKLSKDRVEKVTDVVNIGDWVKVKVIKIDEKGRIDLRLISK